MVGGAVLEVVGADPRGAAEGVDIAVLDVEDREAIAELGALGEGLGGDRVVAGGVEVDRVGEDDEGRLILLLEERQAVAEVGGLGGGPEGADRDDVAAAAAVLEVVAEGVVEARLGDVGAGPRDGVDHPRRVGASARGRDDVVALLGPAEELLELEQGAQTMDPLAPLGVPEEGWDGGGHLGDRGREG